ncbi:MAG: hemolysin, partial [Cyanobacteria bacterium]|nr:hemolysin [Cyanobacteria bacterium CG_2015-04_32_10]
GNNNDILTGGNNIDILTGGSGSDILTGDSGNDTLNLGRNDRMSDIVRYSLGSGVDTINEFVKGSDKLSFTNISFIDVKVSGFNTELRLGNGISGDGDFGTGSLLVTIKDTTGFSSAQLGVNGSSLDVANTAQFFFA